MTWQLFVLVQVITRLNEVWLLFDAKTLRSMVGFYSHRRRGWQPPPQLSKRISQVGQQ